MCGILGQIKFNNTYSPRPDPCLLKHRGPDGTGEWVNEEGTVYLGHTRLAIIDPTLAGKQPMRNAAGRFIISFNGEIYNHLELRAVLDNIQWRGESDTETLVELLSKKGVQALPLLKGMFAFALYDEEEDTVLLVRDRLGIKPLWLYQTKHYINFSSEIRALLQSENRVVSKSAISEYLAFGRMPENGEIVKGIVALKPGSWIKVYSNGQVKKGYWWSPKRYLVNSGLKKSDCEQHINRLVSTAVQEHLISDVGVGAFLSGGIDSSIVTLIAGKILGKDLRTFTIGFPEKTYDERTIARNVAKQAGSEHNELEVNEENCLEWIKEAVHNLDLPSVDAINTFIVSKAVRKHGLKVALSGLGGDELFGGYPSFRHIPLLTWLGLLPQRFGNLMVSCMPKKVKQKLEGVNTYSVSDLTIARRRLTPVLDLKSMNLEDGISSIPKPPKGLDTMGLISWSEIQNYMIPMLLRDSDQMSMAVGLEIRVPFLDHILVENVLSLKQKYKKGKIIKPLLVNAFKKELPVEVYNRPKQGFVLPMNEWILGPLASFINEGIYAAAELLHSKEPLIQYDQYKKKALHWTRIWHWSILGHWMVKQKIAIDVGLMNKPVL